MVREKAQKPVDKYFDANRGDVVELAKALIGFELHTKINGHHTAVRIVETEAYRGRGDKASHAANGRTTARNAPMYGPANCAYVYLIYGIHHMFNVVCGPEGQADAILARAGEPILGQEVMMQRRGLNSPAARLTAGPGLLCQALGITLSLNRYELDCEPIFLKGKASSLAAEDILAGPRVGVDYAGEDALLPWRFWQKDSPWKSPAK